MWGFADCYTLASNRSAHTALSFLASFAPKAVPSWNRKEPYDATGVPIGSPVEELAIFLEKHSTVDLTLYFKNPVQASPYHAILVYCPEGSLILGLSTDCEQKSALKLLEQLERHTGCPGYWGVEEAPVGSRAEFLDRLRINLRTAE